MPIVLNVTEEEVSIQARGNWFTWKPGQRKTIRDERLAQFIQMDRRGYGLCVLPELTSQAEDDGDIEVTDEELAQRKATAAETEKSVITLALNEYVQRQRSIIKNAQVGLARDLARAEYKYDYSHEMSDGELQAMELVAKYDKKGKDAAQERIEKIKKLEKQIG